MKHYCFNTQSIHALPLYAYLSLLEESLCGWFFGNQTFSSIYWKGMGLCCLQANANLENGKLCCERFVRLGRTSERTPWQLRTVVFCGEFAVAYSAPKSLVVLDNPNSE
jgi:hypothetical protein